MTKKKRSAVIAVIVIIGIAGALFLLPNLSNLFSSSVGPSDSTAEIAFQERLLEYADYGLFLDDETQVFFYNEQSVRRLVDGSTLFTHDDGLVEISIIRNREGGIIEFNVKNAD